MNLVLTGPAVLSVVRLPDARAHCIVLSCVPSAEPLPEGAHWWLHEGLDTESFVAISGPCQIPAGIGIPEQDFYRMFCVKSGERFRTCYPMADGSLFRAGCLTYRDGRCVAVYYRAE